MPGQEQSNNNDVAAQIASAENEHDKIKIALDASNCKLEYAAILLRWPTFKLRNKLDRYPDLMRYIESIPPTDIDTVTVATQSDVIEPTAEEVQLSTQIEREDELFTKDLQKTGFTQTQTEYVLNLARLTKFNFKNTLSLIHGGMTANFIDCQLERNKMRDIQKEVLDRLADFETAPPGSTDRLSLMGEANQWARRIREIDDTVIRVNDVIQRGALTQILSRRRKQEKVGYKPGA